MKTTAYRVVCGFDVTEHDDFVTELQLLVSQGGLVYWHLNRSEIEDLLHGKATYIQRDDETLLFPVNPNEAFILECIDGEDVTTYRLDASHMFNRMLTALSKAASMQCVP